MIAKSLERVPNWKSVLAAMVYFATFLAVSYGGYALTRGVGFLESFLFAFPRAFGACVLLFLVATAIEAVSAMRKGTRQETKPTPAHTFAHR